MLLTSTSWRSESAGKMLDKDDGVMFFKLFEQPSLLFERHGFTGGNVTKKLFEALQRRSLTLVFVLL